MPQLPILQDVQSPECQRWVST